VKLLLHHLDLLAFLVICALVPVVTVGSWVRYVKRRRSGGRQPRRWVRWTWTSLFAVELGCLLYGHFIEPRWLEVTHHHLQLSGLGGHLRVVHLTDLHMEGADGWPEEVLAAVEQSQPDLVVLTGDYLNHPSRAQRLREFLDRLVAVAGHDRVFAVTGNFEVGARPDPVFADAGVHLLDGVVVTVTLRSARLQVAGIGFYGIRNSERMLVELAGQLEPSVPSILLHHTPDLAESPGIEAFDLVLCGHTHGGQVRLPGYGALITLSRYGKSYEAGLYRLKGKGHLYTNRGIGTEPAPAIRVRFLCRPEVAVFDLEDRNPNNRNH
jgi:predicted MPP superfamily phosphohydrolase